jgi:uncharacterized SAM-binding protein YcdF (DUF218 family)
MFFILSKILSFLLNPLFWVAILLLLPILKLNAGSNVPQNKYRKRGYAFLQKINVKRSLISAFLILFICGNSVIINELNVWWEGSEGRESISDVNIQSKLPKTAVVLGGYLGYDKERNRYVLMEAGDRFMVGFQGLQLKKFDRVILSGGSSSIINHVYYEAIEARKYMISLGVDSNKIIIDPKARNTYENAVYTKHLLDSLGIKDPICLITSAGHMNRSAMCYKKVGIPFVEYRAHFTSSKDRNYSWSTFIVPSAGAIRKLSDLIHEWIGILAYKFSGKA